MARLIYAMNTSLDGYISDRDGKFEWGAPTPELFAAINELERPFGTYRYGRHLYETKGGLGHRTSRGRRARVHAGPTRARARVRAMWRAANKIVFSTKLPRASTRARASNGPSNPTRFAGLPRDLHIPLELVSERRLGHVVHLHYRRSQAPRAPAPAGSRGPAAASGRTRSV
jgi:hypothetical protein